MNTHDKIIAALTPGTPFNSHNRIFRSLDSLAAYANIEPEQVLDLLMGDLSSAVVIKPAKGKKGLFAALKSSIPPAAPTASPTIKISGGNAFSGAVNTASAISNPAPVELANDQSEASITLGETVTKSLTADSSFDEEWDDEDGIDD